MRTTATTARGNLNLREAIGLANGSVGADTITFDATLSDSTIILDGSELEITEALTIDARSISQTVTIDANNDSRIFKHLHLYRRFLLWLALLLPGAGQLAMVEPFAQTRLATSRLTEVLLATAALRETSSEAAEVSSRGDVTLTNSTVSGNSTAGF